MDFASIINKSEPHQRTIVHLDMDYYYAQVEEIRDPTLRTKPLGIQQKNIVVTCNYVAREFGVKKLMLISEAQKLCPSLVLVNGEDLTAYRHMSQQIFDALLNYTPLVEKLGFDENFLDVSALVEVRKEQMYAAYVGGVHMPLIEGHIYPENGMTLQACGCGCAMRLAIGTQIAKEIREDLRLKLGITCCAGVSYNKLLAKLVGARHKPNQQTVLVSTYAEQFMRELQDLHGITGIGQKTASLLLENGIANVAELQQCDMDMLRKKCGFETAVKLKDLAFGRDPSAVRPTGKPKSIGLEESCKPVSVRTDVEERFRMLLLRLMEQVAEDGRIPITVKVTLRKFDAQKKSSHRECKQVNILPSLFKTVDSGDPSGPKVELADGAQEKLLNTIMRLFERIVDLNKPFNITLIGLAFSKFQQRKAGTASIANFLIKKADLEVQSITSLTNNCSGLQSASPTPSVSSTNSDEAFRSSPTTFQPSDQFYRRRTAAPSPIPMLVDNGSESGATTSDFSDFSETEVEPSPKKARIGRILLAKRRCLNNTGVGGGNGSGDLSDTASPCKLRVRDLRLSSRDSEKEFSCSPTNATPTTSAHSPLGSPVAARRFRVNPPPSSPVSRIDRLSALRPLFTTRSLSNNSSPLPSPSPMDEGGQSTPTSAPASPAPPISCSSHATATTPTPFEQAISNAAAAAATATSTTTTMTDNLANIPCPVGVDAQVFNELPFEVQNELIVSWRNSLANAAAVNINATNIPATLATRTEKKPATHVTTEKASALTRNGSQKNTIYRYFLRNK